MPIGPFLEVGEQVPKSDKPCGPRWVAIFVSLYFLIHSEEKTFIWKNANPKEPNILQPTNNSGVLAPEYSFQISVFAASYKIQKVRAIQNFNLRMISNLLSTIF